MIKSIIGFFKKFWFKSNHEEYVIAPCVGDIIEYEDGSRTMVAVVDISEDKGVAMYDVRFFSSSATTVNKKGRSLDVVRVSKDCEIWPPKSSVVIRDGKIVYPTSKYKLKFLHWLNTKL
tara:strand:+ start:1368 stop:1724 length:357 start_codon:yes stop_codon:yes gene_type:complete